MSTNRPKRPTEPLWGHLAKVLALAVVLSVLGPQGLCEAPAEVLDARAVEASL